MGGKGIWRSAAAVALITVLMLSGLTAARADDAADSCAGPGPNGPGALVELIERQPSCEAALKTYESCMWGSSADTTFGAAVAVKCEKDFVDKLTPSEMKTYADRMQLCAYRYSATQGTLYMSMAATCQAELAASFAKDPKQAKTPLPKASFDCSRAASPIEKTICAAPALGRADLVLNEAYREALSFTEDAKERQALIASERAWMSATIDRCRPDGSAAKDKIDCLRSAFEARFTAINQCSESMSAGCLEDMAAEAEPVASPRASFDCDAPATALEVVICADAESGQADLKLSATYKRILKDAEPALRQTVIESERTWLHFVETTCPLGVVGAIPSVFTRGCVTSAFETRTTQLEKCVKEAGSDPGSAKACLNAFAITSH